MACCIREVGPEERELAIGFESFVQKLLYIQARLCDEGRVVVWVGNDTLRAVDVDCRVGGAGSAAVKE